MQWLKAEIFARPTAVDMKEKVLRGYVVAQEGPFKTPGRGEFDLAGLKAVRAQINAKDNGIKSRFGHPTMSDDGIGKFLGRAKNATMSEVTVERNGKQVSLAAVRADLHFDPTAESTPNGNLASYVLNLAQSDPDAISSSLVLEVDEQYRIEKDGTPTTDANGDPLPPLWMPKSIHASDIVDTGDAVDGILSAQLDAMPVDIDELLRFDGPARFGVQVLDKIFGKSLSRELVQDRCEKWLAKYLARRFGDDVKKPTPILDKVSLRLREMAICIEKVA